MKFRPKFRKYYLKHLLMNMEGILNTDHAQYICTVSWLCSLLLSWINIHNTVAPIKLRHFEHATFVNQLSTVMW